MKKGYENVFLLLSILFFIGFVSSLTFDSALIRLSLKEGETVSSTFSISSELATPVGLKVENIQGISFNEYSFFLLDKETRKIPFTFNSTGFSPGVYFGNIELSSKEVVETLPVVLEIESKDVFFDGNLDVPPSYSVVSAGDSLGVQLKIFDLTFGSNGLRSANIELDYSIYSTDGRIILSDKENLVVDNELTVSKTITLPKTISEGDYLISAVIKYKNSIGISSEFFQVGSPWNVNVGSFGGSWINWIGLFVFLIVVAAFVFFIFVIRDRDKLFRELKEYNYRELVEQRKFLLEQQKLLERQNVPKVQIVKQVQEKVKYLKEKHQKRVHEFLKIRKTEESDKALRERLKEWKSKGYNTLLLESKLKGVSVSDMKNIMKSWRKKGYK